MAKKKAAVSKHETVWEAPFNSFYRIAILRMHDENNFISLGLMPIDSATKEPVVFRFDAPMIPKIILGLQRALNDISKESAVEEVLWQVSRKK